MNNDNFTVNNNIGLISENLISHTIKKNTINSHINDMINLKYTENDNIPFDLYNENPKKISLINIIKFRNPIRNFIVYQYSIKAKTFVERKLLKQTKLICCRNMNTFPLKTFTIILVSIFFLVGNPSLKRKLILLNLLSSFTLAEQYWWIRNSKNIMLNFQINSFYKLGRETKEFIQFMENNGFDLLVENNKNNKNYLFRLKNLFFSANETENFNNNITNKERNFKFIKEEKTNLFLVYDENNKIITKLSKSPLYYKKFFSKDIFDIKLEKDDEIIDYLNLDINYDFHKEYLKKIRSVNNHSKNSHDLLNLVK